MEISGPSDRPTPLATVRPAGSTVRLHWSPEDSRSERYVQALFLPMVLLAGTHGRREIFRNVRLLRRESQRALFDVLRGERDAETAATDIIRYHRAATAVLRAGEPVAASVDRFFLGRRVDEPGYLDAYAGPLADLFPDDSTEDVRVELRRARETAALDGPVEAVHRTLADIEGRYDRRVAERVADVTLDVPFRVDPLSQQGRESRPAGSVDLEERLERVASRLVELDKDPTTLDDATLEERLQRSVDGEPSAGSSVLGIHDTDLPVLDLPVAVDDPTRGSGIGRVVGTELGTTMGRLLTRCFGQGSVGGAVYETASGTTNWLVNPWVSEGTEGDERYAARWQRAYLGRTLVRRLVDRSLEGGDPARIDCPLCRVSPRQCGGSECGCQQTMAAVNQRRQRLVAALRSADERA
jgi:hypothetical protein